MLSYVKVGIKANFTGARNVDFRKTQELQVCSKTVKLRHVRVAVRYFDSLVTAA